ncbi:hypothetical protein [Rhodopila sp.]|jgi:hypothetical protein|uniref:hypothetical protein n=1 Tax=Rhodopila sp. TaxID=2480087 RepID=UPI002CF874B2|nr:hypothetical protein [Rhodopila sp.]HVZ10713.1 hypothetical protein [Rhodopila sp.]
MEQDPEDLWRVRNAAAVTVGLAGDQMCRAVRAASVDVLVGLLSTFSPRRGAGPDWVRGFDPLIERLWCWRDDATMAALAEAFKARGPAWASIANALSADNGKRRRTAARQPAWAHWPAFAVA